MVNFGDAAVEISALNGIINHSKLKSLDYASAGHTGSLDLGASDFITTGNISATTISGITISGTNIYGTTISGTTYRGTNIYGTTLISGPTIIGDILSGTDLRINDINAQTYISGPTIIGNILSGTDLRIDDVNAQTYVSGATIIGTTVSGTNINATPSYTGGFTSAGVVGGIFVPRDTDAAANDFVTANFTTDGTFNDLDLSGIVPVGAKAVVLKLQTRDSIAGAFVRFRKKGNSNQVELFGIRQTVSNLYNIVQGIVELDSSRVVEYWTSNTTWTNINVHVMGWFI